MFGPILVMALGALIFCGGAAWYFWPARDGKPPNTVAQLPSEPTAAPLPPIAKPEVKTDEKPGRVFVPPELTPERLLSFYEGNTAFRNQSRSQSTQSPPHSGRQKFFAGGFSAL